MFFFLKVKYYPLNAVEDFSLKKIHLVFLCNFFYLWMFIMWLAKK